MPDHTSVTEPRTKSQNSDGQHCHTRLIALMWHPLITISLVNLRNPFMEQDLKNDKKIMAHNTTVTSNSFQYLFMFCLEQIAN
jgi:hypothetical protein